MAAVAITNTPQDITGDFDLQVRGNGDKAVQLQKSLGSSTTNWGTCKVFGGPEHVFVKNTGTNSFRLVETVENVTVEWNQ